MLLACLLAENAHLVRIEREALSKCCSLRSFYIPRSIEVIGENCFSKCVSLRRLTFASGESLKRMADDLTLDEALDTFGFDEIMGLLSIEIEGGGACSDFPGWSSVADDDSHVTLIHDLL
jgi:hypothetical protein